MALLEMQKIRIVVCKEDAPSLLEILQKLALVEFTPISENLLKLGFSKQEKKAFEFNYVSGRLDFTVNFLSKFQKRGFLKKIFEDNRVSVSLEEAEKTFKSFSFNDIVEQVIDSETKINEARQKIDKLDEEKDFLSEWIDLKTPLNQNFSTKFTETTFVKLSRETKDDLESELENQKLSVDLSRISDLNFSLTFLKESKDRVLKLLSGLGAEIVELPKRDGQVPEILGKIEEEKQQLEKVISEIENDIINIGKEYLPRLKILSDYLFWKKEKDDALLSAVVSRNVSVFEGWVPKKRLEQLKANLEKEVKAFTLEEISPEEGENPPVEIENKKIFKPFEVITRLYGLPASGNLDPTAFLAAFFFIFFGLCLTDVVYGLVVLVIFSVIVFAYKIPKETKPLYLLLMLGGLASVIVGVFFGGYLGIEASKLPEWLRKIQLFDPISSPLPVFYLSLGLGVCQIMTGMILKIISEARNGRIVDGLLDQIPWLSLFVSLILFVVSKFGLITPYPFITWMVFASLAAIVLTGGRKQKGIIKKGFSGVLGLYNFVNYFSDMLSYSRLLALGLATSALAFAINLIAILVRDLIPYVGLILMVVILIIGHLFNIVVNILGAFIHSSRLQFVEFFSKFLSDTGKNFRPFRQEERNVVIIK